MPSTLGTVTSIPAVRHNIATHAEQRGEKLDALAEQAQSHGHDRVAARISKHADNFDARMDQISNRIDNVTHTSVAKSRSEAALARFEAAENRATERGHTEAASVFSEASKTIQGWLDNPAQGFEEGAASISAALGSLADQAGETLTARAEQAAENGDTHRSERIEARSSLLQRRLEDLAAHFAPAATEETPETVSIDIVA